MLGLPLLDATAFDVRSDKERARDILRQRSEGLIRHYVDCADIDTMRDILARDGKKLKAERTPQEKTAGVLARTAQVIFFGAWGLVALHLLRLF